MSTIKVYDPPLCCSSGVCGQDVDQALVDFAAAVDWAQRQGAEVERFNLANDPMAFAEAPAVRGLLERSGEDGLPAVVIDGEIALAGTYPSRAQLARWAGIEAPATEGGGGCCGGSTTCC